MIYIECGLDFDNNKFGFGRSVEIDNAEEGCCKKMIRLKNKRYCFRFWIFKTVFVISRNGFDVKTKKTS